MIFIDVDNNKILISLISFPQLLVWVILISKLHSNTGEKQRESNIVISFFDCSLSKSSRLLYIKRIPLHSWVLAVSPRYNSHQCRCFQSNIKLNKRRVAKRCILSPGASFKKGLLLTTKRVYLEWHLLMAVTNTLQVVRTCCIRDLRYTTLVRTSESQAQGMATQ